MEFTSFLSLFGTLLSIVSAVAPIPGILNNGKKGSFDLIPVNYLYINHLSQGLWLLYAIIVEDPGLILVSTVTFTLSGLCLILYIYYAGQLVSFLPTYAGGMLMVASYIMTMFSSTTLGGICALISICLLYTSPSPRDS